LKQLATIHFNSIPNVSTAKKCQFFWNPKHYAFKFYLIENAGRRPNEPVKDETKRLKNVFEYHQQGATTIRLKTFCLPMTHM
jgi:hypothetical protein